MSRRDFLKKGSVGVTSAAVGASLITSAPAIAQSKTKLTVVSTWPRDFPGLGVSAQRLVARISELSEGRIETEYFAAPMGMTTTEWTAWINFKDGQALWDEVAGEFGLKCLPCGATGTQMGGWFNKEIESADDLKGLKMRIPGLGGDVMAKLGASPVSLPGGQIYENLVSGAIDATEWVGPYNDYFMKFYEAAKFYYAPGFHEPGGGLSFGMNKEFWEGLGSYEQEIIRAACQEEHSHQYHETVANNGIYLARMVNENGVEVKEFSDEIYDSFAEASAEVFEETRDHSELAAKVHDNFTAALTEMAGWMAIAEIGYSNQRNRFLDL